jgi:hypothetical protein
MHGTQLEWLEIPIFRVKKNQPNQHEIDAREAAHKLDLHRPTRRSQRAQP